MALEFKQLALDLKLERKYDINDFYAGSNEFLIKELKDAINKKDFFNYFYIWGDKESGKTHILKGLKNKVGDCGKYLDFKNTDLNLNQFLELSTKAKFLFLDNIEKYNFGNRDWEIALFNVFNDYKLAQKSLIIASNCAIKELCIELADLKSRLSWGLVHKLVKLSDEEKHEVLIRYAKSRYGINLSNSLVDYILMRASRNMQDLFKLIDTLSVAGIEEQKEISKPFIKRIIGW